MIDNFIIDDFFPDSPKRVNIYNYNYKKCDFMFPTENKNTPKTVIEKFKLKNDELVAKEIKFRALIINCTKKLQHIIKKIIELRRNYNPSDEFKKFIFECDKNIDRFNGDLSDFSINKVRLVALYDDKSNFDILANKILN